MGRIRAFAAYATLLVAVLAAACTSSSDGPASTSPRSASLPTSSPPSEPSSTAVASTPDSTPRPVTISNPGPPRPGQPSVPRDVPTTGPNTRPGEKPPVMPLEATQHTARGARAFAAFFIKTIDWGFATVSGSYIRHYAAPHCDGCDAFINSLDRTRRLHRRYKGGRIRITDSRSLGAPDVKRAESTVVVTFDIASYVILTPTGRPVAGDPADFDDHFHVSMDWVRNQWSVEELTAGG